MLPPPRRLTAWQKSWTRCAHHALFSGWQLYCFHTLIACLTQQLPLCALLAGEGKVERVRFCLTLLIRYRALVVLLASQKGNSAALQHYAGTLLQVSGCAQGSLCDMYRCADDFRWLGYLASLLHDDVPFSPPSVPFTRPLALSWPPGTAPHPPSTRATPAPS